MSQSRTKRIVNVVQTLSVTAALLALVAPRATTQQGTPTNANWRTYGGEITNTRYSPLSQIDASNFSKLTPAWIFSTASFGPTVEANLEATPLVIDGVLYSTVGDRRDVVALDAATGEIIWTHREDEGKRAEVSPRRLSGRGLSYWADGAAGSNDKRIVYFTQGYRMIELDAKTGNRIPTFGGERRGSTLKRRTTRRSIRSVVKSVFIQRRRLVETRSLSVRLTSRAAIPQARRTSRAMCVGTTSAQVSASGSSTPSRSQASLDWIRG